MQWTREKERDIFGLILSEILNRIGSLEFFGCDIISSKELRVCLHYTCIFSKLLLPFRGSTKLRDFHMVGGKKDGVVDYFRAQLMNLLFKVPSARSLKCLRDDGDWYHIGPDPPDWSPASK